MYTNTLSFLVACGLSTLVAAADPVISSFANSLVLDKTFDPIKAAYWTGLPHHRRTPFSVSPDGKSAYLAYLSSSYNTVVVQGVSPTDFTNVGTAVEIEGYEAAGLVAQNDGFALMATVNATGTTDLPTDNEPIVALIRYKSGVEAWRTNLNGPGVHATEGLTATPDANGDLVYSSASGLYGAYFVVTAYTGDAAGHFGDSIQYVDDTGALQTSQYSSTFGCSHNTGIGLEAADAPPFASICAEDHGAIWLNTDTQYMSGVKIANENTTNGVSGEPMGGMSGSYSNLALFPNTTNYVFAWQSRGALDLTQDTWMGTGYSQCSPRWLNHNVAIATMSKKDALTGAQAISTIGAAVGDAQVNWITESTTEDHQNVHVGALSSTLSVVSWETLTSPTCQAVPLGCSGTYSGTSFQFVDNTGAKVGSVVSSTSVFVSGDFAVIGEKICWPYVDMTWSLSAPKDSGTPVSKMGFACISSGASTAVASSSAAVVASSAAASIVASSSVAVSSTVATSTAVLQVSASTSAAASVTDIAISSSVAAVTSVTPFTTGPTSASYGGGSAASTSKAVSSVKASTSAAVSVSVSSPTKASVSSTKIPTTPVASSTHLTAPTTTNTSPAQITTPTTVRPSSATPKASGTKKVHTRKSSVAWQGATGFSTVVRTTPSPTPTPSAAADSGEDDECEW